MRGRELPGYPFNIKALCTRATIYTQRKLFANSLYAKLPIENSRQEASNIIAKFLRSGSPCMVGKIGTNDGEALLRYLDIHSNSTNLQKLWGLFSGKNGPFWWDNSIRGMLCGTAGCFPPTETGLNDFCKRFMEDCRIMDVFGAWVHGEKRLYELLCPTATVVELGALMPLFVKRPWMEALRGYKVLVIHPYVKTIQAQYSKRRKLFDNPDILPDFELQLYKPVISIGGTNDYFGTWTQALNHMCAEIRTIDFDIALIGAGGYGIPIAADIKRSGRKAIHTGGATQIMFGIKGGRWDHQGKTNNLYNKHWIRPLADDIPPLMASIENGCFV